jgi:hypothetical protein
MLVGKTTHLPPNAQGTLVDVKELPYHAIWTVPTLQQRGC